MAAIPKPLKPVDEKKKPISQFALENERALPPSLPPAGLYAAFSTIRAKRPVAQAESLVRQSVFVVIPSYGSLCSLQVQRWNVQSAFSPRPRKMKKSAGAPHESAKATSGEKAQADETFFIGNRVKRAPATARG
ncbi:MAG: hypothetical protein MR400_05750 [Clostridiales bacterium]|nr:hypothetical protein [Clostridiales bacterium]